MLSTLRIDRALDDPLRLGEDLGGAVPVVDADWETRTTRLRAGGGIGARAAGLQRREGQSTGEELAAGGVVDRGRTGEQDRRHKDGLACAAWVIWDSISPTTVRARSARPSALPMWLVLCCQVSLSGPSR